MDVDLTPRSTPFPNPRQRPCPICGRVDFRWGSIVMTGGDMLRFSEESSERDAGHMADLTVRECVQCGNIQWFTRE